MSDNFEAARRVIGSAATTLQPGQDAGAHYARALNSAGLLADPAQTTELERLRSELRVAKASEAFGKVAVAERDHARAALESTQDALREMEQKRDAWKVAAGVDYRNLDVSPDEASLIVSQWQSTAHALSLLLRGMARDEAA